MLKTQLTSGTCTGLIQPLEGAAIGICWVWALVELAVVVAGCVGGSQQTLHLMFVAQWRAIIAAIVVLARGSTASGAVSASSA